MHNNLEASPQERFQVFQEAISARVSADAKTVLDHTSSGYLASLTDPGPNRKAVVKLKDDPKIRPCFERLTGMWY